MRVFIAVEIPKEVTEELKSLQKHLNYAKLKLVRKFHMTLKFLGEVAEPKIEEIKISLSKLEYAGFKASLTEIGVFPNQNYVRVVWAGVEQEDFIRLQAQIDSQLAKLGFKKDKRFHPHLTLARVNFVEDKASFGKLLSEIKMKNLEFKVDEFKLIKSTLTREGPIYEDLAVFKLSS